HLDQLLSLLKGVQQRGEGWRALCPGHDDHEPSLDVDIGENGQILLICRSRGCSAESIVTTVGLCMADLFPEPGGQVIVSPRRRRSNNGTSAMSLEAALAACRRRGTVAGNWVYVNAANGPHLLVVRIDEGGGKKSFRQFHAVGDRWAWRAPQGLL